MVHVALFDPVQMYIPESLDERPEGLAGSRTCISRISWFYLLAIVLASLSATQYSLAKEYYTDQVFF